MTDSSDMADIPHILVVDDDTRLRELLRKYLKDNGFLVSSAADAVEARRQMGLFAFDLMVLDVMMPGETGLELARSLRRDSALPILMLTAMSEPEQRIDGLEAGVDDYLTKPFEPRELVLRIQTILRRVRERRAGARAVTFGPFAFELEAGRLTRGGEPIYLTSNESALLTLLARHPGEVLSREKLLELSAVGGGERNIDVQINRIRKKIETIPNRPVYLQTVRGAGYVLHLE